MAAAYLKVSDLLARWGISRASLYRGMRDGYYPRPVRLAARTVRFSLREVEQFEERIAADRVEAYA